MLKAERHSVSVVEPIIGPSRGHANRCSYDAGEREYLIILDSKIMSAYVRDDMPPMGDAVEFMDVEVNGSPRDYLGGVRQTRHSEEDLTSWEDMEPCFARILERGGDAHVETL